MRQGELERQLENLVEKYMPEKHKEKKSKWMPRLKMLKKRSFDEDLQYHQTALYATDVVGESVVGVVKVGNFHIPNAESWKYLNWKKKVRKAKEKDRNENDREDK